MKINVEVNNKEHSIDIVHTENNQYLCNIDGKDYVIDVYVIKSETNLCVYSIISNGRSYDVMLYRGKEADTVYINGFQYSVKRNNHLFYNKKKDKKLHNDKEIFHISATIPGKIIAVKVEKGVNVKKGEPLVVIEAMKMENELRAPADGKIINVYVKAGDKVENNTPLIDVDTRIVS